MSCLSNYCPRPPCQVFLLRKCPGPGLCLPPRSFPLDQYQGGAGRWLSDSYSRPLIGQSPANTRLWLAERVCSELPNSFAALGTTTQSVMANARQLPLRQPVGRSRSWLLSQDTSDPLKPHQSRSLITHLRWQITVGHIRGQALSLDIQISDVYYVLYCWIIEWLLTFLINMGKCKWLTCTIVQH